MPSSASTLATRADQGVGILLRQGGEDFDQPPVGPDGGEDAGVLHLPGHHDLADAFLFADLDQAAEFAERDPVAARGGAFDVGRGFLFDGDGNGFVALTCGRDSSAISGKRPLPAMMAYFIRRSRRASSFDYAALGGGDEGDQFIDFGAGRHFGANALDRLAWY